MHDRKENSNMGHFALRLPEERPGQARLAKFQWRRCAGNPVLRPGGRYDADGCMNPFVVRVGDEYWMYYSGVCDDGHRICLATARLDDPATWTKRGMVLDLGGEGRFDRQWLVLPLVMKISGRWHLYYTGRNTALGEGLQSFCGIGLAVSDDGLRFERYSDEPIITGDRTAEFPANRGIAGGGSILTCTDAAGRTTYRMYYTLAVGITGGGSHDQEKHCAVCCSDDGIAWRDHRVILSPRPEVETERWAVAAPHVWYDHAARVYRMLYCGIGRPDYSIAEAVSADGYNWSRGPDGSNISLLPDPANAWETKMVEYPMVLADGDTVRLFYCGNGFGATGIGMAVAENEKGGQDV